MDLKSLLEKLDTSVISEEVAKEIAEAFETAVNEKVENRISLQLEKSLSEQDDDHAKKLEKLFLSNFPSLNLES
jgi:Mn-dependent DtxR family transcriptional regulator